MGDPKRQKKKYKGPSHLWQKQRIEEERSLMKEYNLVNKKEIWRIGTISKDIAFKAKGLIVAKGRQAELERKQLLERARKIGLLKLDGTIEDALAITLKDALDRRLATMVFRKKMSRTMKQARQLVVHGHIKVAGKKITSPDYLVPLNEEDKIAYAENSPFFNPEHPERPREKAE